MKIDNEIVRNQFREIVRNGSYTPKMKSVLNKISTVIKGENETEKLNIIVGKLIMYVEKESKDKRKLEIAKYAVNNIYGWKNVSDELLKQVDKKQCIEDYVKKIIEYKLFEIGNVLDNQYQLILDTIDSETILKEINL